MRKITQSQYDKMIDGELRRYSQRTRPLLRERMIMRGTTASLTRPRGPFVIIGRDVLLSLSLDAAKIIAPLLNRWIEADASETTGINAIDGAFEVADAV